MARDDGGPAFGHGSPEHGGDPGMSLRDYFAIHATADDIRPYLFDDDALETRTNVQARWMFADAMLSARGGTDG